MNNAWDHSLDTFIESLPSRPRNALKSEFHSFHNGYSQAYMKPPHTLRHLLMYTKSELMRIPNLGKHSIQEIDDALAEHGLHLYEKHTQKSLASLLDYQPKTEPIAFPEGYEIHEIPPDYSGPVWIEGQVRRLYELATKELK